MRREKTCWSDMTDRVHRALDLIRQRPGISFPELAVLLGMAVYERGSNGRSRHSRRVGYLINKLKAEHGVIGQKKSLKAVEHFYLAEQLDEQREVA